jgi:hypothetical protein
LTAAPTKCTEDGGEVVITTSIPSRFAIRIAAGIAGHEQAPARELQLLRRAHEAGGAVQLLRRLAPLGPEVARAVHPREGRRLEVVVDVDPLRIVGSEHVRLDPEFRQVCRKLERPLHAAAAGGREVHRDEEDLHPGRR